MNRAPVTDEVVLAAVREKVADPFGGRLTQKQIAAKLGCPVSQVRRLEKLARIEARRAARLPLGRWVDEASAAVETLQRLSDSMRDPEGLDSLEDEQAHKLFDQGRHAIETAALLWVRREACRREDGATLGRLANPVCLAGCFQPSAPESPAPRGGGLFSVSGGKRGAA